tara:strand:+ start:1276 stop:1461 length:186 start_codon:yes stop_codon:yes gene_type:complete
MWQFLELLDGWIIDGLLLYSIAEKVTFLVCFFTKFVSLYFFPLLQKVTKKARLTKTVKFYF